MSENRLPDYLDHLRAPRPTMNQKLPFRWLGLLLLLGWLAGCATVPPVYDPIQDANFQGPTLAVARARPEAYLQTRVRWSGAIARVDNRREETWLEIVEQPLGENGRPTPGPTPARAASLLGSPVFWTRPSTRPDGRYSGGSADQYGAGSGRRLSDHLSGRDGRAPPALAGTPHARSDLHARSLLVRPRLSVGLPGEIGAHGREVSPGSCFPRSATP